MGAGRLVEKARLQSTTEPSVSLPIFCLLCLQPGLKAARNAEVGTGGEESQKPSVLACRRGKEIPDVQRE